MKTRFKTLLAALILSMIALSANAQFNVQVAALKTAKDWPGLTALANANISGDYVAKPATPAQQLNNDAIAAKMWALMSTQGDIVASDYALSKKAYGLAATRAMRAGDWTRAIAAQQRVIDTASAADALYQAKGTLLYCKGKSGVDVNADILALLASGRALPKAISASLLEVWRSVKVSDTTAFYDALLLVTESNAANAELIGKILDQKAKLK